MPNSPCCHCLLLPKDGSMDIFVLILDASDGSELCNYHEGSDADDVVTAVVVDSGSHVLGLGGGGYPDITIAGYTEGSLAGRNGKTRNRGRCQERMTAANHGTISIA